ncbi:acyl carrier protein (plasmid) [Streptomyces sp. BI20]|uniref:acyl carrier protein n=1 Tax=Streptomyces sp. BI20 TaxID=3403460 RepID=UPI003C76ADF2
MLDRPEFTDAVTEFLTKSNPEVTEAFGPDDNLFTLGLVDSLRLVELIVTLERLTGREIPVENYSISSFYTINGLYDMVASTPPAPGEER